MDVSGRRSSRSWPALSRQSWKRAVAIDLVALAIAFGCEWLVHSTVPYMLHVPEHDPSLSHPLLPSEVPGSQLLVFAFVVPLVVGLLIEVPLALRWSETEPWVVRLRGPCNYVYGLMFALVVTTLLTDIAKRLAGYPRPNFYNLLCGSPEDWNATVQNCVNKPLSPAEQAGARQSFPSGHTSSSFVGNIYLALQMFVSLERVSQGKMSMFIILICCAPFCLAAYVGASRVRDWWHHPADVAGGAVLGTIVAGVVFAVRNPQQFGYVSRYGRDNLSILHNYGDHGSTDCMEGP